MSSWGPADLVSDVDLQAYERDILARFNVTNWQDKRRVAIGQWLFPLLKNRGFDPFRLITRAEVDLAYGFTGGVYTDVASACKSTTVDDLDIAAIFATPATDVLYLASTQPFRGVFVAEADTVGSAASVLSVKYWNGAWSTLTISDGTSKISGKAFSGGGSITWSLPLDGWVRRSVNSSEPRYWVKVTVSAVPTAAKAGQIAVIRESALCAPVTARTLELIFREAPTAEDGPWKEKAEYWAQQAELAFERALPLLGGEFDSDDSDEVSPTEAQQTAEQVSQPWALERA